MMVGERGEDWDIDENGEIIWLDNDPPKRRAEPPADYHGRDKQEQDDE
jgi:hypothetical protein